MSASALHLVGAALRYALDHAAVACWIERSGVIRYANPAFTTLVGVRQPEDILGRPISDLLDRAAGAPEIKPETLLAGLAPTIGEEAILRSSGQPIAVELTRSVVTFDSEVMILTSVRDITAERKLRSSLADLEERYRRLIDSDLLGVIEIDEDGVFAANDYFLRIVGRSREELARGELRWREMMPPARLAEFAAKFASRGECGTLETEVYRPDGSTIPLLLRCAQMSEQPRVRAMCFVVDLTSRKQVEERAAERLRCESVGMLAAGLAHSLNNLLTTIIGNAALLLEDQTVAAAVRPRDLVAEIITTGEQVAAVASELLAYSGQGRFVLSSAHLREILEAEVERLKPSLPANIRFKTQFADDLLKVIGDPKQLRYVFEALIRNAIEAIGDSPNGEVFVETRMQEVPHGTLTSRAGVALPGGQYCLVRVRDNGVGMDASTSARAFEPFFSTKFQGRGLGLAAVAGIVNAAGGTIRVRSEPGKGSEFQVYLPPG